jgi:hypothetical protein
MLVKCDHAGKPRCDPTCPHGKWHKRAEGIDGCGPGGLWRVLCESECGLVRYQRVRCIPRKEAKP